MWFCCDKYLVYSMWLDYQGKQLTKSFQHTDGDWESLFLRSCERATCPVCKMSKFPHQFHVIQRMSQWNQLAFIKSLYTRQRHVFWGHSADLRRCFDRCNKAPLAWSQVNNSSWLMFLFLLLVPVLWLSLAVSHLFWPPLHAQYSSRCVFVQGHIPGLPPSVYTSLNTSPLPKTDPPLLSPPAWHTLSSASCVETGTVTCWSSFHFIFHTSAVNTFAGAICSPWKQIVRLDLIRAYTWNFGILERSPTRCFLLMFCLFRLHVESSWMTISVPEIHFF